MPADIQFFQLEIWSGLAPIFIVQPRCFEQPTTIIKAPKRKFNSGVRHSLLKEYKLGT